VEAAALHARRSARQAAVEQVARGRGRHVVKELDHQPACRWRVGDVGGSRVAGVPGMRATRAALRRQRRSCPASAQAPAHARSVAADAAPRTRWLVVDGDVHEHVRPARVWLRQRVQHVVPRGGSVCCDALQVRVHPRLQKALHVLPQLLA
jgi:hypothetical protein